MEGLLALAILIERLVETFVAPMFKARHWPPLYQRYIAVVLGLAITLTGSLNALALLPDLATVQPLVGQVVTGFLLGGGASLLHELIPGKPAHP